MQFSNAALGSGIVQDIDKFCGTDDNSYPIADKTRDINAWYDRVVSLILLSDGRWQWDDSNQTTLPRCTATLVDGQKDYQIAGSTFLEILRVEIKDNNGNYQLLKPFDERDIKNVALSELYKTNGMPVAYDKIGDSVILYPTPAAGSVTTTKGLRVNLQRGPSLFVVGDTTKSPGFNPLFHRLLSFGPSLDYCLQNEMVTKIKLLQPRVDKLEQGLVEMYSQRSGDEKVRATISSEDYGGGRVGNQRVTSDLSINI